jgi:hypothetical protein
MTRDCDLDVMNLLKELPEDDASFYFRSDPEDGFFYHVGTLENLGVTLAALMEQDENIRTMVIHAVNNYKT